MLDTNARTGEGAMDRLKRRKTKMRWSEMFERSRDANKRLATEVRRGEERLVETWERGKGK
jgi:hypothetical protein